eukprot:TRINITY_DN1630_c0_g1_i6.p2 TRINITY_DN1630_c0_g1~~TRINITY_DN1630_c0_g1_i6.p2  ORF type:complete len:150 (-),score=39.32 TRINITY_DN1630_c0_g1_i6:924-1373(-)
MIHELDFSEVTFGASTSVDLNESTLSPINVSSSPIDFEQAGSISSSSVPLHHSTKGSVEDLNGDNTNDSEDSMITFEAGMSFMNGHFLEMSPSYMAPPVIQPLFPSPNMQTFLKMDPLSLPPPALHTGKSVKHARICRYDDEEDIDSQY